MRKAKIWIVIACFILLVSQGYYANAAGLNDSSGAVCYVVQDEGKMYYSKLSTAIAENNNSEIFICNSTSEELIIPAGKNFTVYANGYNLAGIENYGNLVFDGGGCSISSSSSGTVSNTTYNMDYCMIQNDSVMSIKNVKIIINHNLTNKYVGTYPNGFKVVEKGVINNGTLTISDSNISISNSVTAYYGAKSTSIGIENNGKLVAEKNEITVYGTATSTATDRKTLVKNTIVGIQNNSEDTSIIKNNNISVSHDLTSSDSVGAYPSTSGIENNENGKLSILDCNVSVKSNNCASSNYHRVAGIANNGNGTLVFNGGKLEVVTTGKYNHATYSYGIFNKSIGTIEIAEDKYTEISVASDYGHPYGVYNQNIGGSSKGYISINKAFIIAVVDSSSTGNAAYGIHIDDCNVKLGDDDAAVSIYPTIYGGLAAIDNGLNDGEVKIYDGLFQAKSVMCAGETPDYVYPLVTWYDEANNLCGTLMNKNSSLISSITNESNGIRVKLSSWRDGEEIVLCKKSENDRYAKQIACEETSLLDANVNEGEEYLYTLIKSVGEYVWVDQESIIRKKPIKYYIEFNGNGHTGGSMASMQCISDNSYTLTSNKYVKTGYTFNSWNTKADGTGIKYTNSSVIKNLSSVNGKTVTLYAIWNENQYKIKFDANGATSGQMNQVLTCKYSKEYTLPKCTFTRDGYQFVGWSVQKDGTGKVYSDCQKVKAISAKNNADVVLYAVWEKNVPEVNVYYRTHVQTYGWQNYVSNGETSGTYGQAKRLEGINIRVEGNNKLGIIYTTHCQTYGWLPWSSNNDMNGTEGEAKRLEAIEIKLTGADKDKYDVCYRVHAQSYGWLGWAKNGQPAGTAGYGKRLEGIQIVIVKKGTSIPKLPIEGTVYAGGKAFYAKAGQSPIVNYPSTSNEDPVIPGEANTSVAYRTHVQSIGWQGWKFNGQMSGTSGMAKRLEGIEIKLTNKQCQGGITYRTHVQKYGWQAWRNDGVMAGTSGEALRLEAIEIKLTGEMANQYDVYYRVHAQSYGWLGWAKNGASSGTAGYGKRLEGIQIVLVKKGSTPPSNSLGGIISVTPNPYIEKQ